MQDIKKNGLYSTQIVSFGISVAHKSPPALALKLYRSLWVFFISFLELKLLEAAARAQL